MPDVGITAASAYVPYWRLKRKTIGEAWGIPAAGGERAAAAADEDALTMAVETALHATGGMDPSDIDGVIFASTTSPYREKQTAATIAAVLDLKSEALTLDVADSLRGATTALRVAVDAIRAGSARTLVVCAGDARMGEPESSSEQLFGDAAAAVVVQAGETPLSIQSSGGVSNEFIGPWRRSDDRFVRSFDSKLEVRYGYAEQATAAARQALAAAGVDTVAKAVIAAPDPRAQAGVAKALGLEQESVADLYFAAVGNTGTAAPLLMLAGALEKTSAGEAVLLVGAGDGADALVLQATGKVANLNLTEQLESKGYLATYERYARSRRLVERERNPMWSSAITYWRDRDMELPLYGLTCRSCGTVQYPAGRRCMECSAPGPHERTRLTRRGKVFTFTLDHLVLGEYHNEPVPRAVIDLEDGGRMFCELTDCDPQAVEIDMPVELTFRCLHEGASFRNYYWKGRPIRVRAGEARGEPGGLGSARAGAGGVGDKQRVEV